MKDKNIIHYSPLGNPRPAKRCAISGWQYFRKFEFDKLPFTACVDYQISKDWAKQHPGCYFIDCSCGGLGGTFILVDRIKKEWINVTDYGAW